MPARPQYKEMIRRVCASMTSAIMNGVTFDRFDDLYPANYRNRQRRIESFQRQFAAGVRQIQVSPAT